MPEGVGAAGRRLVGQGREAEILEWDDGTVLRLLRSSESQTRVQREATALRAAAEAGIDVPAVYGTTTVEERAGLIMGRVDGPDLITLMGGDPGWCRGRRASSVPPRRACTAWSRRSTCRTCTRTCASRSAPRPTCPRSSPSSPSPRSTG